MPVTRKLYEEAVLLIVPWIRKKDLPSFARTCKLFYEAALPLFYEELRWTNRYGGINKKAVSIRFLFRSIRENPSLLPLIKHFEVTGPEDDYKHDPANDIWADTGKLETGFRQDDEEVSYLKGIVRSSGLAADEWFPVLRRGEAEALIPLLLIKLPALKTLRLGARFHTSSRLLGTMLAQVVYPLVKLAGPWAGPFSRLEKIEYINEPECGHWVRQVNAGHDHVQSLFYLPSVQHINVALQESNRAYRPFGTRQPFPNATNLRTLIIMDEESDLGIPADLIIASPSLCNFAYYWNMEDVSEHDRQFDFDGIIPALWPVADTLQRLTIRTFFHWVHKPQTAYGANYGFSGAWNDLSHFKKLERLEVPIVVLMERTVTSELKMPILPPLIREICVTNELDRLRGKSHFNVGDVMAAFEEFFSTWKIQAPNLKKIVILTNVLDSGLAYDDRERGFFEEMCKNAGVECEFEYCIYSY